MLNLLPNLRAEVVKMCVDNGLIEKSISCSCSRCHEGIYMSSATNKRSIFISFIDKIKIRIIKTIDSSKDDIFIDFDDPEMENKIYNIIQTIKEGA